MKALWSSLSKCKRISLKNGMGCQEHKLTHEGFGVYALWDKNKRLLYVGHSHTDRKAKGKYCGIKDRLDSHRLGGGTLGTALFAVKVGREYTKQDWEDSASGKLPFASRIQKYIRKNVQYSFVKTTSIDKAKRLERWIHTEKDPLLNNLARRFKAETKRKKALNIIS